MILHKFFQEKLAEKGETKPLNIPPEKLRPLIDAALKQMFANYCWQSESPVLIRDENIKTSFGDVRVRFYFPNQNASAEPLPLYVQLHGGGWWLGTVESLDPFCKELAQQLNCVVASIEYSLSPEAIFPQALEESYQIVEYLSAHAQQYGIDHSKIAVGGNSAGANLAAALTLMFRDRGGVKISCQWLDSPATDAECNLPSYQKNNLGFLLTGDAMRDAWGWYLNGQDKKQAYASPLYADLNNLPPALVMTSEYDPLCDDGRLYAYQLKSLGNIVRHFHYEGMVHGFMGYKQFSQSKDAFEELLKFLKIYLVE